MCVYMCGSSGWEGAFPLSRRSGKKGKPHSRHWKMCRRRKDLHLLILSFITKQYFWTWMNPWIHRDIINSVSRAHTAHLVHFETEVSFNPREEAGVSRENAPSHNENMDSSPAATPARIFLLRVHERNICAAASWTFLLFREPSCSLSTLNEKLTLKDPLEEHQLDVE